tara:strand:- start:244 stop:405 length:162 start_codon:yes stop_codon:yes gene_type:complete
MQLLVVDQYLKMDEYPNTYGEAPPPDMRFFLPDSHPEVACTLMYHGAMLLVEL